MNLSGPFVDQFNAIFGPLISRVSSAISRPGVERNMLFGAIVAVAVLAAVTVLFMALMPKRRKVVRKRRVRRVRRQVAPSAVTQVAARAAAGAAAGAGAAAAATAKKRPERKPLDPKVRAGIGAGIWIAAILLAFVLTYYMTGTDNYCGNSCHAPDAHVTVAKQNHHANCIDCHESDPVSGMASRVSMAFEQSTGFKPVAYAPVDESTCLRCHSRIESGSVKTHTGLVISHKEILSAGRACGDCHASEGHKKPSAATLGGMSACIPCHDGKTASRTCSTCHAGGSPLSVAGAVTKGSSAYDYGPAIRVAQRNCMRCHAPETECKACHNGLVLPHPADFVNGGHARIAAFDGKQRCLKCHTMQWCGNDRCHHAFAAHDPAQWKTGHQSGSSAACGSCHMSWNGKTDFCKVCH